MLEHELSYNIDPKFLPNLDHIKHITITDYYFDKNSRIRRVFDPETNELYYLSTIKTGSKESGTRTEEEAEIQLENESFLKAAQLKILKKRYKLFEDKDYEVILDVVESPMRIASIEIEFCSEKAMQVFKSSHDIEPCPLSAWDFHKRRIGIAGGPSSGKTTVAKKIALILNNEYNANTSDVVEYATSFIQKMNRNPGFDDQSWIYIKQSEREEAVGRTANIVLSDCPVFLGWIYASLAMQGMKGTEFTDFARESLFKRCIKSLNKYQFTYLLETIEYKENGIRFHNLDMSKDIFNRIKAFLIENGRSHKFKIYNYNDLPHIVEHILCLNDYEKVSKVVNSFGGCQI